MHNVSKICDSVGLPVTNFDQDPDYILSGRKEGFDETGLKYMWCHNDVQFSQ